MTPARRSALPGPEAGGDAYRDLVRQMGTDGWLGVGWPKEYGGQGRTPAEQFVFYDEAQRAGVPMPLVTLNTVGPTLMRFGSDEQKRYFLPRILAGELHFAIGYTEPAAGTDLASLRTRAVRDGDQYVVNGQKVFTTGGNDADWLFLAGLLNVTAVKFWPILKSAWTVAESRTVAAVKKPASHLCRIGKSPLRVPPARHWTRLDRSSPKKNGER